MYDIDTYICSIYVYSKLFYRSSWFFWMSTSPHSTHGLGAINGPIPFLRHHGAFMVSHGLTILIEPTTIASGKLTEIQTNIMKKRWRFNERKERYHMI